MTAFDLLKLLGEAQDDYIMDSRKRPKKRRGGTVIRVLSLAACAVLLIGASVAAAQLIGGGSTAETEQSGSAVLAASPTPSEETSAPSASQSAVPEDETGNQAVTDPADENFVLSCLASAVYPDAIAYDDTDALSAQWTDNQVTEDTSYSLNAFSYQLAAAALQNSGENGCISPLSLYQSLSILASGAEGTTRDQLLSVLGQSDTDTLAEQVGRLYRLNYMNNDLDRLQISNSLWLSNRDADGNLLEYKLDWAQAAASSYYADVYEADFTSEDTQTALAEWISETTGGTIQASAEETALPETTVMAIVNTLWYKTQWAEKFSEDATTQDTFTAQDGTASTCDFMHTTTSTGVIVTEEYTKSYLTLNHGKMIFVLPAEGVDIDTLLAEDKLWEIFEDGSYGSKTVSWSVPKFETTASYQLEDVLKSMGITDAFDLDSADFSLISDNPLFVGTVRQGTRISLDENGVEAASYTDIGMMEASDPGETDIVEMNLNRPFIYLITANDGSTLFMGVVRTMAE